MSENPFTDGQQFSAARLNSMYNAHQNNGVLSGLSASTSVNAFDVDISSGEAVLNGGVLTPASATVSHATSDPEDRIDLITVDATETISVTQGNPAATSGQPIAPDIPTDELLLALVYVRGGSSEILTGDIFNDYKVILQDTIPELISPQGEGSGINADLVRGNNPVETVEGKRGDVTLQTTGIIETQSPASSSSDSGDPASTSDTVSISAAQNETLSITNASLSATADNQNEPFDSFSVFIEIQVAGTTVFANGSSSGSLPRTVSFNGMPDAVLSPGDDVSATATAECDGLGDAMSVSTSVELNVQRFAFSTD